MRIIPLITMVLAMFFMCPIVWGLEQQSQVAVEFQKELLSPYIAITYVSRRTVGNAGDYCYFVIAMQASGQETETLSSTTETGVETIISNKSRGAAYLTDRTVYKGLLPG